MAKYVYPAVFTPEDGGYTVCVPDIPNCFTDGDTLEEAMEMAQDALCLMLYDYEQQGSEIPAASPIGRIQTKGSSFTSLIACDTLAYHRRCDNAMEEARRISRDPSVKGYATMEDLKKALLED